MKKRTLAASVLGLLSVVTLAACSGTTEDTNIITMKGDTITVSDFYDQVKTNSASQEVLLNMVLTKVFEEKYGDEITDDQVSEEYNKYGEQYGSSFSSVLSQAGLTADGLKSQIRLNLLMNHALTTAAEEYLTDENYKAAYENYTPEMTAELIVLQDEETANSVLEKVKEDGADFASIASENTTVSDSKIEYTFDSTTTDLPADVLSTVLGMKKGETSDIITVFDTATYSQVYYIVKVTKTTEKAEDWKEYKDVLKDAIINEKLADTNFTNSVISEALSEANVKIKDDTFSALLSQFATTGSTEESTTSESSEKTTEESSEETTEESSEESSEESTEEAAE